MAAVRGLFIQGPRQFAYVIRFGPGATQGGKGHCQRDAAQGMEFPASECRGAMCARVCLAIDVRVGLDYAPAHARL